MSRPKSNKPKRNIWKDPSPYGTYTGVAGSPDSWKASFEYAAYSREKALNILKTVIETPFQILGIPEGTLDQDLIKTAYRKLAVQYHPDKGGDRDMFEKVTAAYSVLKS
jgi:DnaJ-domain-containing protein 1